MSTRSAGEEARSGAAASAVAGERSVSLAHRARSLESRISNLMAVGVMGLLGLGVLTWYYGSALTRAPRAARASAAAGVAHAPPDAPLPPLGRIRWADHTARKADEPEHTLERLMPPTVALAPTAGSSIASTAAVSAMPPQSVQPSAMARRLSGPPFARQMQATAGAAGATAAPIGEQLDLATAGNASAVAGAVSDAGQRSRSSRAGEITELLKPAVTAAVSARALPTQRYLLPKGAFIDCTLETAIDSTLPGMTTCITATDTFSVDGSVVLLERGSKLVGETRGQVQQGSARVFVVWTEVRTPTGVVVPLDSPGTDELGRAGLAGRVERHFWDRFGAAILISVIDSGTQAATRPSGGTFIYSPTASQDVMTEVLKGTIDIPPSVVKNQGDRIQVLVARDLDFRSVYELRPLDERR